MVELALVATIAFSTTIVLTDIDDAIQLLGIWFAIFIGFYYYIDASIRAARLTDPLFRDTLHWTRVRAAFWAYVIGATIVFPIAAAVGIYNYENGGIAAFFQAGVPALIIAFSGLVALPLAIRRSKDKVLKRQLSWFAAYMMWLVLLLVGALSYVPDVVSLLIFLAGTYPLYRSATSLVPLYKFDKEPEKSG